MNETETRTFTATEDLDEFQSRLAGPEWLRSLRAAAAARFAQTEWPKTSEEEWRRTNLSPFEFDAYEARPFVTPTAVAVAVDSSPARDDRAGVIAYRDELPESAWVDPALAERGVVFGDLHGVASGDDEVAQAVRSTLERTLEEADNRLISWHLALMQSAVVLYVPANVAVEQPFEIDLRFSGDEVVAAPHLVAILERGAEATIVRRLDGAAEGEVLLVDANEFVVNEGARLKYVNLQRMNEESVYFGNDRGNVARDAHVHRTEAALGSDFVKSRYVSELTGAGADAVLNGIYFATDEQHMDLRTVQRHRAPHTTSRAFYRGAVRDESHAIYQGLIQVDHEAAGTDAYLTNKNLILSEESRADSIPSLNIATDDVRCSHGSTTGRLDATQLFYLRSRGFSEVEAKRFLVEGYFEDLIAQTPPMLHDELRELIMARIGDGE
ncbi:MAG: Fe-S cluster assembly protein SufD [Spirochaetota bacterium]